MPEATFQPMTITVTARPLVVPAATPPPYPLLVGSTFRHFAAPNDAMGWFAKAAAMLSADNIAYVNSQHPDVQFRFIDELMTAIESGANCLNIYIWSDPTSRAIYRKWMSGPPVTLDAVFNTRISYGGDVVPPGSGTGFEVGWYVPNSNLPVIADSVRGIIPRGAREKFKSVMHGATNPNQFVPTIGFDLSTADGTLAAVGSPEIVNELLVNLQTDVRNQHWVIQGTQISGYGTTGTGCAPGMAYPRVCQYIPGQVFGVGGFRGTQRVNNTDWNAWDTFFAQAPFIGSNSAMIIAEGPAAYIPFLRELVDGFVARTPAQIIQDARAFVTYENAQSAIACGGPVAFLTQATGASGNVLTQMVQANAGAQAFGSVATAIGSSLVAAGGYAALVGLALMVVGAATTLADKFIAKDVTGHGKDDLGRFKPVLERNQLSGDANAPVPVPPGYAVQQAPAGVVTLVNGRSVTLPIASAIVVFRNEAIQRQSSSTFPVGKVIIGAVAAVAGWQLWKYLGSRKS